MALLEEDFGKSIELINLNGAFFLDTNIIISWFDDGNSYHLAVSNFLERLLLNEVPLYICETVVVEVIHVLARSKYIIDEYNRIDPSNSKNNREKRKEVNKLRQKWSSTVCKNDKETLKRYNQCAVNEFQPLLEALQYVPSTKEDSMSMLQLSVSERLLSGDAMIEAAAKKVQIEALLSLDKDVLNMTQINVLTTNVENDDYDEVKMREDMELPPKKDE
ncbi:PIN domain-containing protein [Bacillus cereus]|uniref:type II toxin-antitoxin system VapC family toxin n=1 Tax=Bacillus cereus TaxID=1396 RepID=UPI001121F7A6|nr:PIN domain-containing protein [Bacillus cereus]UDV99640.1 PIN domain-containing protein [Bacillus cereus]